MSNINIWEKYKQICKIGYGTYGKVYKVQNIETGEYFAMKEIEKEKFEGREDKLLNEVEIMKKINTENSVLINEVINNKEYLYIIMDLCEYDLENYIKRRKKPISINEIKEVLNQLNNVFKIMNDKKIIHRDLKPSNILISLDRLDKCLIKLSDYGSSKFNNLSNTITNTINGTPITMAPEILNGENYSFKSDIWSLGIIIYFMLNKKYPYNGKNEVTLLKDINSGKRLKLSNDDKLNDLINKMLKININERISWDEYFNHPFFQQELSFNYPIFDFKCNLHNQNITYFCKTCKLNICEKCLNQHSSHKFIHFSKIGLNNEEVNKINYLMEDIKNNLNHFKEQLNNIQDLINQMKLIKENLDIYDNNSKYNYKNYYIDILRIMNNQLKNKDINLIDLKQNNYIICEYDIKNKDINKLLYFFIEPIRILNCYEEAKEDHQKWNLEGINNDKEIKENCELYLNENKIDFCYKYKFGNEGKYTIKFIFQKPLINMNYMFYECDKLLSIDLSNFNTNNVTNMIRMFSYCSSLTCLNLSNFNTNNVNNMSYMFVGVNNENY